MGKKGGLGKGLGALFIDNETETTGQLAQLRISDVEPNKDQPRTVFDQEALEELAESIREHGVLQPIVVRSQPGGIYQIIAGERRWRASRIAGLVEIPAIVLEVDDNKVMELALIENLQREGLNPIEEAQGYQVLIETYHMTQDQVAKRIGKSRPAITNSLRLLSLPQESLDALSEGKISVGHGRVLAGIADSTQVLELTQMVMDQGLNVRQLEKLAREAKEHKQILKKNHPKIDSAWGDNVYKELEISLEETLGRKVKINTNAHGGTLEVTFLSLEDLRDLAHRLTGEQETPTVLKF